MLHNEQSLFEQVILRVSEDTGIEASIIEKDYYRQDYEDITAKILFEEVSYETAVTALKKIIASGIFSLT